jgi:hypothetical protein
VQLPAKEKDNEKVVGVPKLFKPSLGLSSALLDGKPDHDTESGGHDPAGDTSSGGEVENDELNRSRRRTRGCPINGCELAEVPHVGRNMDRGEDDNRPGGGDVELDVIVERNDIVQRGLAEERDEIPADWEKNEDDIEMEDECGGPGNCWTSAGLAEGTQHSKGQHVPKPRLTIERVPVKVSLSW